MRNLQSSSPSRSFWTFLLDVALSAKNEWRWILVVALCCWTPRGSCFVPGIATFRGSPLQSPMTTRTRIIPTVFPTISSSSLSKPLPTTALMGIKGFRGWFESQFPSAIVGFRAQGAHEKFDHVLIDINQILHTSMRKSRSENHGLALLLRELDACVQLATPTQSLVLAMDGPPGAAKLSTQRQRRKAVLVRSTTRIKQLERLVQEGIGKRKIKKSLVRRQKRKATSELRTLSITPGTEFMEKAAQAMLFWAWQRMQNPRSPLARVKIYLSPSTVPGEGEVKLLEWIYTKKRKGDSIAIMGGDSDLVLEGLIVPPGITHDIFVLLPDGSKKYLAVSLWETTRALKQDYIQHMSMANMMKVRTDLVVLFILNGNDYLPKLRGSSGFSKLFQAYKKIQNDWNKAGRGNEAYLIDPDLLTFNFEFCIDFFSYLAASSPGPGFFEEREKERRDSSTSSYTPLAKLRSLSETGILPKPIKFKIEEEDNVGNESDAVNQINEADLLQEDDLIGMDDEDADNEEEEDEENDENGVSQRLLRLSLGVAGTEDFFTYDLWWNKWKPLKAGRHKLAEIALSDILGLDTPEDGLEDDDVVQDLFCEVPFYDWELRVAAESKVDSYLYGLLWNLQTYQDGICGCYAFNYGKRKSPTAADIVTFLENARETGQTLGPKSFRESNFTPPIDAGLSCLAALPSDVRELIPEPYCRIPKETVEDIYSKCVDKDDNTFDILSFKRMCEEYLVQQEGIDLKESSPKTAPYTRRDSWTVISRSRKPLSHPFDPPLPFDESFTKLRRDNSIRITQIPTIDEPRHRQEEHGHFDAPMQKARTGTSTRLPRILHSSPGREFLKLSINDVPHRSVYTGAETGQGDKDAGHSINVKKGPELTGAEKDKKKQRDLTDSKPNALGTTNGVEKRGNDAGKSATEEKPKPSEKVDLETRMRKFNLKMPAKTPPRTQDGLTATACLQQLMDTKILASIDWDVTYPSDSEFASFDPASFELLQLKIRLTVDTGAQSERVHEFSQDREVNKMSKKELQQQLASFALDSLLRGRTDVSWQKLKYKDVKSLLLTDE